MPTNILKVSLEFLQNQLNNTSFGFKILDNGTPVTFTGPDGSVDNINKTFKTNSNLAIKYMMSLNADFTPNVIDNPNILPGFDQPVEVIKRQSNGKYIVVGQFTKYRDELLSSKRICRLNEDFTIDYTFNAPDFQYNIFTMDIDSSDRIYIGSYNTIGTRKYLQRLLSSGELDTSYMNGLGFNQEVTAIKLQSDGKLLVGGVFTTFNSTVDGTITANRLIRLTTSGNKDTSFNGVNQSFNNGSGIPIPRTFDIKSDGKIVAGGDFILYNNVSCENIVVLTSTGAWSQTPTGLDNSPTGNFNVNKVLVDSSNNVYAVGNFRNVGGTMGIYGQRIIKLTNAGLPDTTFNDGLGFGFNEGFAKDIAFNSDGNLVVVGNFLQYNTDFNYVPQIVVLDKTNAALNPTGEISGGWSGPLYGINCVCYNGTGYIIGGRFTSYNNPNVYESQYVIPIQSTSELTQTRSFDNFELYDVNANITYTEADNIITFNYEYDDTHTVDVIDIFDIPEYLIIRVDGSNAPPEISLLNEPQKFTPAYNPVVFRFSSLSSFNLNFRYIIDLYNSDTNTLIARLRIAPTTDYTGYIDISKILSNALTVDFDPQSSITLDATKSYINYSLKVGGEFNESWSYDLVEAYNESSPFVGYTQLTRVNETTNTFSVGDTISIKNSTDTRLNGLFNVVVVVNDYSFVIDLILPDGILSTTTGFVVYADNRKTYYADQLILDGYCAFNGVRSWNDFINWKSIKYTVSYVENSSRDDVRYFLTDLPTQGFTATLTQDLWLNFYNQYDGPIRLQWITNLGQTGESNVYFPTSIMQVNVGPNGLGINDGTESYIFYLKNENDFPLTAIYNITIDNRCKIEDYEILFMDRMGSLASYSFPLRAMIRGKIEKDTYKKSIQYNLNGGNYLSAYDITTQGTSISNINYSKTFELNTNWMTEENSLYFEQLLTSPFTWLKIDEVYYSCIIEEKDFEVVKQKNKVLIRKTINVTLGNTNTINI